MELEDLEREPDGTVRFESLRDFVVGEAKIFVALRLHTSHRKSESETFEDRFLQIGMTADQATLLAQDLLSAADRASGDMGSA